MAEHTHQGEAELGPVEACYREVWANVVEVDGVIDIDRVKAELHDYHMLLRDIPLIFDHVTGGRATKPNTTPAVINQFADEHYAEVAGDAARDVHEGRTCEEVQAELEEHVDVVAG